MKEKIISCIGKMKKKAANAAAKANARINAFVKTIVNKIKLRRVSARAGYYTALVLLLALLGTASYAYRDDSVEDIADTTIDFPQTVNAVITPVPTATPQIDRKEAMKYAWPVKGEIIGEFAPDALIWSNTLGQWQTHPAIDISACAGEAVLACGDGIIKDAYEDPLWGNIIIIEHPDGCVSTYANLETLNQVSAGDQVRCGDVISAVGKSALAESEMPWHLHMEFRNADGENLDFSKFIQEME